MTWIICGFVYICLFMLFAKIGRFTSEVDHDTNHLKKEEKI